LYQRGKKAQCLDLNGFDSMKKGLLLIFSIVSVILIWNESYAQSAVIEKPQTMEQASAQQEKAAKMRRAAEERFAEEKEKCHRRFLVNDCLARAKKRYREVMLTARDLDSQARDFYHQVRRDEAQAKIAERIANQERKEAAHKLQAERHRQNEAARQERREKRLADRSQQAEKGHRKHAEEQERHQARQERRERKNAERADKGTDSTGKK